LKAVTEAAKKYANSTGNVRFDNEAYLLVVKNKWIRTVRPAFR
jgi:hypothetical protein